MIEFLSTFFGGLLGIVLIAGFCLYLLAYFFNFLVKGLKYIGIFIVLVVVAFVFDLFSGVFDRDNADSFDVGELVEEMTSSFDEKPATLGEPIERAHSSNETDMEQFIYQFLLAYASGNRAETAAYMDPNARITDEHLDYMSYQAREGISLQLVGYELYDVYERSGDTLEMHTAEHFVVKKNGNSQDVYQEIRYTINLASGSPKISGLEILSR